MKLLQKKTYINLLLILVVGIAGSYGQNDNSKIDELIAQKSNFNKENKITVVYKIQLYNGTETQAYKIKNNFSSAFPEYNIQIVYKSPEWKTQVGNFETRLEADRVLLLIKEKFSGAIVLEDRI